MDAWVSGRHRNGQHGRRRSTKQRNHERAIISLRFVVKAAPAFPGPKQVDDSYSQFNRVTTARSAFVMASGKKIRRVQVGEKFGKLTVVEVFFEGRKRFCRCECECGNKNFVAKGGVLNGGDKKNCGCITRAEAFSIGRRTHGHKIRGVISKEYWCWQAMLMRCYNDNTNYKWYGGAGITVCDRWRQSFQNFFDDMGKKPTEKHSIDRIVSTGNYEPDNCRWATVTEQRNNTSRNRLLTVNGETKTLAQWCRQYGIHHMNVHNRIKSGWTIERAVTQPVGKNSRRANIPLIASASDPTPDTHT